VVRIGGGWQDLREFLQQHPKYKPLPADGVAPCPLGLADVTLPAPARNQVFRHHPRR
jgi:hypothetical protein